MLHVTGYPAALEAIESAQFGGQVVMWRDPLHEGPVPGDLTPEELARLRAPALERLGYGPEREWLESWSVRDRGLASSLEMDSEIVLWFEPVVVDQLQLLDVLRRIARSARSSKLLVVSAPEGLGRLEAQELIALFARAVPFDRVPAWAVRAWKAFSGEDPDELARMATDPDLPATMQEIFRRWLEEFPAEGDGLTRTERGLLERLGAGPVRETELFPAWQQADPWHPVGDAVLRQRLEELAAGSRALVDQPEAGTWRLTSLGRSVLEGKVDRIDAIGFDRWMGGIRVVAPDRVLRRSKGAWRLRRSPANEADVTARVEVRSHFRST